jgi:hypothetical protein
MQALLEEGRMSTRKARATTHLIVRKDHVACLTCATVLPIHPGESGTPLGTFLVALEMALERHPATPHDKEGP